MIVFVLIVAAMLGFWLGDKAWKSPARWTPSDAESYRAPPDHDWH